VGHRVQCSVFSVHGSGFRVQGLDVVSTRVPHSVARSPNAAACREREFFIDNLLVRILLIVVMIRWTGLAPWEFEFTVVSTRVPHSVSKSPNAEACRGM